MRCRAPMLGTTRIDGRKPITLFHAAGLRSDPPVSLPSAVATIRHASATAAPPLDPPADRSVPHGFRVDAVDAVERVRAGAELGRVGLADGHRAGRLHAGDEQAVGGRAVAGEQRRAVRRREVGGLGEVLVGGDEAGRAGPGRRPRRRRRRRRGRGRRPTSGSRATMALTVGLTAAMRARWASSSSLADTSLAPIMRRCSTAVRSTRSRPETYADDGPSSLRGLARLTPAASPRATGPSALGWHDDRAPGRAGPAEPDRR